MKTGQKTGQAGQTGRSKSQGAGATRQPAAARSTARVSGRPQIIPGLPGALLPTEIPVTPTSGRRTPPQSGRRPVPSSGGVRPLRPVSGRPAIPSASTSGSSMEKRRSTRMRFDKAFPVSLRTEMLGETSAVARDISAGGMMLEVRDPLPLGTRVQVFFAMPDSPARIVARGEVKNHYFLNFGDGHGGTRALSGVGVRFTSFESESDLMLGLGLARLRTVLH